jgi:hypothetical protein
MRRMFLLISVLLLSAGWALAQYSSDSNTNTGSSDTGAYSDSDSATQSSGTSNITTFEGCLSEANGKFTLTDQSGTAYELTGKTASLKAHVGHTIEVTGKLAGASASEPGSMSGEQANMEQTLQVSSFRHVSATCKNPMH